jgi:hypothetical protein
LRHHDVHNTHYTATLVSNKTTTPLLNFKKMSNQFLKTSSL